MLCAAPFKVASYNVENLFDAVSDGTEYEEFIPGRHGWNARMFEKKLAHTAEVICDLDADIIGLQEVENKNAFDALRKVLKRVGCGYRYGVITHKKGAPIQVALLSRFPITQSREIEVSYAPRVRNILEVTLRIEGRPLTLFVNHWKSKSRRGYESKRIAYAKALAKRIGTMPSSKEYMILGDLNSDYRAHLTLPKRLDDTNGKRGLSHLLHTVEGTRHLSIENLKHYPHSHYDLWLELPYRDRWSHKFYGHKSTLDHILLPASMFDGKGVDYVGGSFGVFKRDYLFTKRGYINRWQLKTGRHTGKGYSDHLPIYALFDTKPYLGSSKDHAVMPMTGTIEMLYATDKLDRPLLLQKAVVVLKRGRYAVIKQKSEGRGVFVFGAALGLEEGYVYDLLVEDIHTYKGLKEITSMVRLKERGEVDLSAYYASFDHELRQNEVLHDLVGIYRKGYFYTGGKKIPLYFKNRRIRPQNGTKLKIAIAHIGYYKRRQLVVYRRKDFMILE